MGVRAVTKPLSRSEFERLGKPGSYRLGTLAPQGVPPPTPPKQFRPSFTRPTQAGPVWAWISVVLCGAGIIAAGASASLWFVPFLVGLVSGIAAGLGQWGLRVTVPGVVAMSALGWGAALVLPALQGFPVGATARAIAATAGLPPFAVVGVAVTLGVAVLQGLVGLWLGRSLTPKSVT
jgi:hypothetical protein